MAQVPDLLVTLDQVAFEGRGHRVLDAICLRLTARRTFILGPNGAGKSVLLRVMHGLLKASAGEVLWEPVSEDRAGRPAATKAQGRAHAASARAPRLAMVFQRPVMLRRSVLDNVVYGLVVNGMAHAMQAPSTQAPTTQAPSTRAQSAQARAREMLGRVGLAHLEQRPARVLSGGEQQRVALARAWALQPDVLLLDEPTASLDPHGIRAVEAIISEIAASGTAIVMVTHHRGVAKRLAQDIVFMHQGRVTEHTRAGQFFSQPQSRAGQDYLKGDLE